MYKFVLIPLLNLLVFSTIGHAEWDEVGVDSDREFYYEYNIESLGQVKEYAYTSNKKVWIKSTVLNDISQDGLSLGDYKMQLLWINCENQTLGLKSVIAYKKSGKTIPNYSVNNSYVQMKDVIPGTMGEAFYDLTCK